jgi:hypothetical protein
MRLGLRRALTATMDIIRMRAHLTGITVLAISTAASLLEPGRGSAGDVADGADAVDGEAVDSGAGDLTVVDSAVAASAVAEQ